MRIRRKSRPFDKAEALASVIDVLQESFGPDVVLQVTATDEPDVYVVKATAAESVDLDEEFRKLVVRNG